MELEWSQRFLISKTYISTIDFGADTTFKSDVCG